MTHKKKVLLIDDEKDFAFFLKRNLEKTGEFQVFTATRGEKGIDLAKDKKPDLILLDLIMPEMHGDEVVKILSGDARTKRIPVIFLTAVSTKEEGNVRQLMEVGRRNFMTKTMGTEKIIGCIKEVLK